MVDDYAAVAASSAVTGHGARRVRVYRSRVRAEAEPLSTFMGCTGMVIICGGVVPSDQTR